MIDEREEYHTHKGGRWMVLNSYNVILYDNCEGGKEEADDLVWAWNNGAQDDEHAIEMLTARMAIRQHGLSIPLNKPHKPQLPDNLPRWHSQHVNRQTGAPAGVYDESKSIS